MGRKKGSKNKATRKARSGIQIPKKPQVKAGRTKETRFHYHYKLRTYHKDMSKYHEKKIDSLKKQK